MNRASLRPWVFTAALLAISLPGLALSQEKQKFEKSYPFAADKEIKVGIKVGKCTIDHLRILRWPDGDDFAKAEKDLNETHTMVVEFTYSNRDEDHDYKCKYTVTVPGGKDEPPFGQDDRSATLDKGKIGDTNKRTVKMKTKNYKIAKTFKVTYEIWRK